MDITVDIQPCGHNDVYSDGVLIGTLRKFCCGIDFRPKGYNAIFSIMPCRNPRSAEVKDCVRAIMNINIPKGHWNFNQKIVHSVNELIDYQNRINKY